MRALQALQIQVVGGGRAILDAGGGADAASGHMAVIDGQDRVIQGIQILNQRLALGAEGLRHAPGHAVQNGKQLILFHNGFSLYDTASIIRDAA